MDRWGWDGVMVFVPASLLILVSPKSGRLLQDDAQHIIDTILLPREQYGERLTLGGQAQGYCGDEEDADLILQDDPMREYAYGEFPLSSLDKALDSLLEHSGASRDDDNVVVTDVGSGCGRLALYLALTTQWKVYGVEALPELHAEAVKVKTRALETGYLPPNRGDSLALFSGNIQEHFSILTESDILLCYSTAWDHSGFDEASEALVLTESWTTTFAACRPNTLSLTTDRALPTSEWNLLDRFDVPNPEVFESTVYIQRKS